MRTWIDVTVLYKSETLTIENPFKNKKPEWRCVPPIPTTQKAEAGDWRFTGVHGFEIRLSRKARPQL